MNQNSEFQSARLQSTKPKFDPAGKPMQTKYLTVSHDGPECECVLPRSYNWSSAWCGKRHHEQWTVSCDESLLRVFTSRADKDAFLDEREAYLAR